MRVLDAAHHLRPALRYRRGEWQIDSDPVPVGRWAWLTVGLDVSLFWVEAMQTWRGRS